MMGKTINTIDAFVQTVLHVASHNISGNSLLFSRLLLLGGNPNIYDNFSNTTVHHIALTTSADGIITTAPINSNDAFKLLQKLKVYGTNIEAKNKHDQTIFDLLPQATKLYADITGEQNYIWNNQYMDIFITQSSPYLIKFFVRVINKIQDA